MKDVQDKPIWDEGIPIPEDHRRRKGSVEEAFRTMPVGASIFFAGVEGGNV